MNLEIIKTTIPSLMLVKIAIDFDYGGRDYLIVDLFKKNKVKEYETKVLVFDRYEKPSLIARDLDQVMYAKMTKEEKEKLENSIKHSMVSEYLSTHLLECGKSMGFTIYKSYYNVYDIETKRKLYSKTYDEFEKMHPFGYVLVPIEE